MEWNTKSSSLWDWENLFEFDDAKTTENPKKLLVTDCSIEDDRFVGSGSFDSPKNVGCSTEGSGSDTGHTSSKSSKSASMYSSSIEESRATNIAIESPEGFLQEFNGKKQLVKVETSGSSTIPDVLVGSGEPLLGLKLGKRTYFEDIGAGQNAKSSYRSVVTKMCKSTSQTALIPRCQVEGCNLDLSSAKDYHRKHRICESHTKSPRIIVAGEELRFCQQCSRFHGLSEFDDKKRSCRKRLSDHNARRRKPQPEALRLNPTRLSSLYDERQHINFIFDQAPTPYTRHTANLTWNGTESSYLGHTREYISKPSKAGLAPGQLYSPNDKMSGTCIVSCHNSSRISPPKGISSEVLKPGLEEPVMSSNLDAKQDLNGALSLLSTSSWVSCETKPTGQIKLSQPAMTQDLPLASNYWQPQQMHVDNPLQIFLAQNDECSHFQDLNFLKTPYESGLNSGQFN